MRAVVLDGSGQSKHYMPTTCPCQIRPRAVLLIQVHAFDLID